MLAPLRDHLRPKDPKLSSLLCATRDCYTNRLSDDIDPTRPGFDEARWIVSEDVNVEHLLDVFTSVAPDSDDIWDICANFISFLFWHKPRQTVLGQKFEGLHNDHPFKPNCLFQLARSFNSVGDLSEEKRLLNYTLELERERGNDSRVANILCDLSDTNLQLNLYEEGIQQAKEALEIYGWLGSTNSEAMCLNDLARLFRSNGQLDEAEDAATRALKLLPDKGQDFQVCKSHRHLGNIYGSKGEKRKAIEHFETALGIASDFSFPDQLFLIHCGLAELFLDEGEFNDAHVHVDQALLHAFDDVLCRGRAILLRAQVRYRQRGFDEARSEVSRALEIFERLGAANYVAKCRDLLRDIEQASDQEACSAPVEALNPPTN